VATLVVVNLALDLSSGELWIESPRSTTSGMPGSSARWGTIPGRR